MPAKVGKGGTKSKPGPSRLKPKGIVVNAIGAVLAGWGIAPLVPARLRRWAVIYMVFATAVTPVIAWWMVRAVQSRGASL